MSAARSEARQKRSAQVFAALGDARRLALVMRLGSEGPLSITSLTEGGDVTRQAITKHLQVLLRAGLVRATRSGRAQHFEVRPAALDDARRYLDLIARQWDDALERLRRTVERDDEE
jgi:DNA-binding transcriptional ArsR family regulator